MLDTEAPELKTRLLEGALAIVDSEGASGLTVRAVAKAAGCSTMGVYTHFRGKSGLIDAVVDWGFERLDEVLQRAFEAHEGGRDGLVAGALAYRDWAMAHSTQFQAMFVPSTPGYEPSPATRERTWDAFYAHRARVAAVLDGPDGDPALCHDQAARLWAIVHGHVMIEMLRHSYGPEQPELASFHAAVEAAVDALAAERRGVNPTA